MNLNLPNSAYSADALRGEIRDLRRLQKEKKQQENIQNFYDGSTAHINDDTIELGNEHAQELNDQTTGLSEDTTDTSANENSLAAKLSKLGKTNSEDTTDTSANESTLADKLNKIGQISINTENLKNINKIQKQENSDSELEQNELSSENNSLQNSNQESYETTGNDFISADSPSTNEAGDSLIGTDEQWDTETSITSETFEATDDEMFGSTVIMEAAADDLAFTSSDNDFPDDSISGFTS